MIASEVQREALLREFDEFERACRLPLFRSMRDFATEEIILPPGGPFAGQNFDLDRQPWSRLWFDLVDSNQYPFHAAVGPVQTGKTLTCYVIPAMYYLFERGENVGCGVPQMVMAWDKWSRDFLPVIKASRYRDLIPESGAGSQGGKFESITFKNGATLKFLSAMGGDEKRSGVTFRILVLTEVDKYDQASTTSREGNPVTQMIARTDAFQTLNIKVFMECSVSVATGLIWVRYTTGTASKIAMLCPLCNARVSPEREHLIGYQDAENEIDARTNAAFVCPSCTRPWTEEQRAQANANAVLVHRGQEVTADGVVTGPPPKTLTAGFRWNAANNLLRTAADVAGKEFVAKNNPDDKDSQKSMTQFVWAWPWDGETAGTGINEEIVASRLTYLDRGEIPDDYETLVVQIDMHLRWHYWTMMATGPNGVRSVVDYGLSWNPDKSVFGPIAAVRMGLESLVEELEERVYVTDQGRIVPFDLGCIDGGWHQEIAVEFCASRASQGLGRKWRLTKGEGRSDSLVAKTYHAPKERTHELRPGDHWCDRRQVPTEESLNKHWWMVFADTSYWMHQVHGSLMAVPTMEDNVTRRPGSLALFGNDPGIHLRNVDAQIARSNFASQILGWVWQSAPTKKVKKIGWVSQWAQDHWLDTTYGCFVADSVVRAYHPRFRTKPIDVAPVAMDEDETNRFKMPDGRPYLVTER